MHRRFRYFVNVWMFFPSNFEISFRFNDIIFFTCSYFSVHYVSWVWILTLNETDFSSFWWSILSLVGSWNFLRKRLENVSFFSQYGTSIKISYFLSQKSQVVKCNHLPHWIFYLICHWTHFMTLLINRSG